MALSWRHRHRALPGIALFGARTFLPFVSDETNRRPPGRHRRAWSYAERAPLATLRDKLPVCCAFGVEKPRVARARSAFCPRRLQEHARERASRGVHARARANARCQPRCQPRCQRGCEQRRRGALRRHRDPRRGRRRSSAHACPVRAGGAVLREDACVLGRSRRARVQPRGADWRARRPRRRAGLGRAARLARASYRDSAPICVRGRQQPQLRSRRSRSSRHCPARGEPAGAGGRTGRCRFGQPRVGRRAHRRQGRPQRVPDRVDRVLERRRRQPGKPQGARVRQGSDSRRLRAARRGRRARRRTHPGRPRQVRRLRRARGLRARRQRVPRAARPHHGPGQGGSALRRCGDRLAPARARCGDVAARRRPQCAGVPLARELRVESGRGLVGRRDRWDLVQKGRARSGPHRLDPRRHVCGAGVLVGGRRRAARVRAALWDRAGVHRARWGLAPFAATAGRRRRSGRGAAAHGARSVRRVAR